MRKVIFVTIFLFAAFFPGYSVAAETELFSTWEKFEADKCASIWLIKRFIAPKAKIRFFPQGDVISEGIPFDTPDAEFRRYYNRSTFETLLHHYKIADQKAAYIGRIIHDIEINIWGNKMLPETYRVIEDVQPVITSKSSDESVTWCLSYFDKFYEKQN